MTANQLDRHLETQFVLLGLLVVGLLIRLLLAAFSIVPWTASIWLAIIAQPVAALAWLIALGAEETS